MVLEEGSSCTVDQASPVQGLEDAYLKMSFSLNLEIVEQTSMNAWQRAGQLVETFSCLFLHSWWGSDGKHGSRPGLRSEDRGGGWRAGFLAAAALLPSAVGVTLRLRCDRSRA